MAEYENPPLLKSAPANGQVPVFDANGLMVPTALGSLPAAAIPQTHIAAGSAPAAETAVAVATTAATNITPYGYAQAQANAIVTNLNAAVADIAALVTELGALQTQVNTLVSELQTAGILAAS